MMRELSESAPMFAGSEAALRRTTPVFFADADEL
jgi:hypothetical protein